MKRYVIVDTQGDYRFSTDDVPCLTHEQAQSYCDLSFELHGAEFPHEYPFTIHEIEVAE